MQDTLSSMAAERRLPRDRMRIEQKIEIAAPPAAVWAYVTDPANYCEFMEGVTRWDVGGQQGPRPRRALPDADPRRLRRDGRPDRGGRVEAGAGTWPGARSRASTSGAAGCCARPARGDTRVTFRFAYGVAGGGIMGLIAERVAARPLRRRFRQSLLNLKRALEGQRFAEEAEQTAEVAG